VAASRKRQLATHPSGKGPRPLQGTELKNSRMHKINSMKLLRQSMNLLYDCIDHWLERWYLPQLCTAQCCAGCHVQFLQICMLTNTHN